MPRLRFFSLLFLAALLLVGCIGPRPLRPGKSVVSSGSLSAAVTQSENPQTATAQSTERVVETTLPLGEGSRVVSTSGTNKQEVILAGPTTQTTRVVERSSATIGAAQKDTAREIAAKLASTRPVQIVGVILILAALAMFHPVVRAVTASTTLQMVTGAVGLFLIFAPLVVVGNEKILLVAGIGLPAVWFFVHRHGKLQGLVDANKNGIPDNQETGK